MNLAAAIIFVCLAIFGGGSLLFGLIPLGFSMPNLMFLTEVIAYIAAAAGVILGVLGASGFAFRKNATFWIGFQPVNIGLLIAVWSGGRIINTFSWIHFALAIVVFILLLNFIWKKIVGWRVSAVFLILSSLITLDVRALHFFHLAVAIVLIAIPLMLLKTRNEIGM